MADFKIADMIRKANEGGWVNNPKDAGGETAFGWSRVNWPRLEIWPIIDEYKSHMPPEPAYGTKEYKAWAGNLNACLRADSRLMEMIGTQFEKVFWDGNRIGEIQNQEVANWLYDHAVNASERGIRWMQIAANVLPDGSIGPKTIAAINAADPVKLMRRASGIAGAYRLDRAHDDPSQISFLMSWLKRDGQPENVLEHVRQCARDGKLDDLEVAQIKHEMEVTA